LVTVKNSKKKTGRSMETTHGEKRSLRVVAALIHQDGKILFTQRQKGKHLPLLWEFPGGKVEEGESDEEALRRELQEEVGVEAEVGPCCFETQYGYTTRLVHLRVFRCRIKSGHAKALDVKAIKWVDKGDLTKINVPPADVAFVHDLACGRAPLQYSEKENSDNETAFKPAQVVYRPGQAAPDAK